MTYYVGCAADGGLGLDHYQTRAEGDFSTLCEYYTYLKQKFNNADSDFGRECGGMVSRGW